MYPRLFRTLPLLASVALFAAACSDAPTGPAAAPTESTLSSQAGKPLAIGQSTSPYACFTSMATPQGPQKYGYGRLELHFPKSALAPDGRTLRYRYRQPAADGTLYRLANCVIPATPAAVKIMHGRFGIPENRKAGGGHSSGEVGVMTEPVQVEEELVVTACPPGYTGYYPECQAPKSEGDPPPTTGGDPTTGGGTPPGGDDPCYDCEPDDAELDARHLEDWDGTGDLLQCPTNPPQFDTAGCDKIDAGIKHLKNHPDSQCKTFGLNAELRHARGEYRSIGYLSDSRGEYGAYFGETGVVGLTKKAFDPGELANTIAHEEAHAAGWPDKYIKGVLQPPGPDGKWAQDWGRICDSPTI